jgi:hypothetical protein
VRPTIGSGGFYSEEPASDQQDNPFQIVATKPPTKHSNRRSSHIFVQPWFARWYIFIPKIPIWVYFGMENVGICIYGNLVHFVDIR